MYLCPIYNYNTCNHPKVDTMRLVDRAVVVLLLLLHHIQIAAVLDLDHHFSFQV